MEKDRMLKRDAVHRRKMTADPRSYLNSELEDLYRIAIETSWYAENRCDFGGS